MKTRDKIIISVIFGIIAMSFYSFPMWWGVLFSPITRQLATEPVTQALTEGFCWQTDGIVFRLRGLDFLVDFFSKF